MNKSPGYITVAVIATVLAACNAEKPDIVVPDQPVDTPFSFLAPEQDRFYNFEVTEVTIDTEKGKSINSKEEYQKYFYIDNIISV